MRDDYVQMGLLFVIWGTYIYELQHVPSNKLNLCYGRDYIGPRPGTHIIFIIILYLYVLLNVIMQLRRRNYLWSLPKKSPNFRVRFGN